MTPRQQRRFEQKLARKAEKKSARVAVPNIATEPFQSQERSDWCTPPLSEAKLTANRANAQLSTGATTEAGKAIVSQNATKHGLTGKFKVLASESQSDYDKLLAGFLGSESPVGDEELEMVHQMSEALWLSRRSVRLQNECFATLACGTPEQQIAAQKNLTLYVRYQTTNDRTFYRCSAELRRRRSERARAERGFVSQKHKEAAECRRNEAHAMRQSIQTLKQQALGIRNRTAAAKAEALELNNQTQKSKTLAAAA
jgi:hypothetical protein